MFAYAASLALCVFLNQLAFIDCHITSGPTINSCTPPQGSGESCDLAQVPPCIVTGSKLVVGVTVDSSDCVVSGFILSDSPFGFPTFTPAINIHNGNGDWTLTWLAVALGDILRVEVRDSMGTLTQVHDQAISVKDRCAARPVRSAVVAQPRRRILPALSARGLMRRGQACCDIDSTACPSACGTATPVAQFLAQSCNAAQHKSIGVLFPTASDMVTVFTAKTENKHARKVAGFVLRITKGGDGKPTKVETIPARAQRINLQNQIEFDFDLTGTDKALDHYFYVRRTDKDKCEWGHVKLKLQ